MTQSAHSLFAPFLSDRNLECLVAIANGDTEIANMYIPFCDFASILEFLEQIITQIPKTSENLILRNIIYSILRKFVDCDENVDLEFIDRDLKASTDQVVKFLLPFLTGQKDIKKIDEMTRHNLCFYLLIFWESYPGITKVLHKTLTRIITQITDDVLFSITGPDFLYMYDENPPTQFMSHAELDFTDLQNLFKAQPIYKYPEFGQLIQQRAAAFWQFPSSMSNFFNGWFASLANSSIVCKTTFIDLISQLILENLTTGDFENIPEHTKGFHDIVPFFLCAHQNLIYADLQGSAPLLEMTFPKSIASECIVRFKNDALLVNMISFLTSVDVCVADLQYTSIPKQLQFVLGNQEILKYASLKYFSYSETNANIDFNFIRGYNVIRSFLMLLRCNALKVRGHIDDMSRNLAAITDKPMQKKLVIDVFSLLFLKKQDKYLVSMNIARQVIQVLDKYKVSMYIAEGVRTLSTNGDFSGLFHRDPTSIFKAIVAKNWAAADKLTMSIPRYRNLYLMSLSVFSILEKKQLPAECVDLMKWMNLEMLFSFFSFKEAITSREVSIRDHDSRFLTHLKDFVKSYKEAQVVMPQACEFVNFEIMNVGDITDIITEICEKIGIDADTFEKMALTREKTRDDSMLYYLPNDGLWQPMTEIVNMLEYGVEEFITDLPRSIVDTLDRAKQLKEFVLHLQSYYKYGMLCGKSSASSIFEKFDIRRVISGVFNVGKIDFAEELCKKMDVELFDYVVQHLDWFNIDDTFIAKFGKENDVVSLALCLTVPGLSFDSKYKEWVEGKEKEVIDDPNIELIMSGDSDIDDLIYRIDHRIIYNRIMEKNDNEITGRLFDLLQLVDYVADECDVPRLRDIYLLNRYHTNNKQLVVEAMIENGQINDVFEFMYANEECVTHVINIFIDNNAMLNKIFARFSKKFDGFYERFAMDISKIDLLMSYGPEERRPYLMAVPFLPKCISSSCNVLDIEQIKDALKKNPALLNELDMRVKAIVTDDVIASVLDTIPGIIPYTKYSLGILAFVDSKQYFIEKWYQRACEFVRSIRVVSVSDEETCLKELTTVWKQIGMFEQFAEQEQQIRVLHEIMIMRPCARVGIEYAFGDFGNTEKLGEYLIRVLFLIDADESLVSSVSSVFGIKLHNYYLNICANMIRLGYVKEARRYFDSVKSKVKDLYIEDLSLFSDQQSCLPQIDPRIPFLSIFGKHSVFNPRQIELAKINTDVTFCNGYLYICDIVMKHNADVQNDHEIKYYTTYCTRPGTSISLLMFNQYFDLGYQLLMSIDNQTKRAHCFIHNFYYSVVSIDRYKDPQVYCEARSRTYYYR